MSVTEVSPLNRCQTENARRLCIYELGTKLKAAGQYDIGGTHSGDEPDLWFFCYTSMGPGFQYLLNLFVCHRKPGIISIDISDGKTMKSLYACHVPYTKFNEHMTSKLLRAVEPDETNFITTYCFRHEDVTNMKINTLYIPIKICLNPKQFVSDDVIRKVKLQHNFGDLLVNKNNTDLVINTPSGKSYNVHKIILAAHSPLLGKMIKSLQGDSLNMDISDNDIEMFMQFLYTGTIGDLANQRCIQLLEIADRFQLKKLFDLTKYALSKQVTIDNAVEIALLSEKYKLEDIQTDIFAFIKQNPQVLQTDGWKNLNDVALTKKLLEHTSKS